MAFDQAAYVAKIKEYMQQMAQASGYKLGENVAPYMQQQQPQQQNPLIKTGTDAAKQYLKKQAFSALASQAPGAVSTLAAGGPLTATGAAGVQSAAMANAGLGSLSGTGLSSGMVEGLAAQGAVPAAPASPGVAAAGAYLPPVAAAIGTYLAGKSALNTLQGKKDDNSAQGLAGRAQLAFTTMGASELAKLGIGTHKSTRDIQRGVTSNLLKMAATPGGLAYVQGMRQGWDKGPTNPDLPFGGKYRSFDEYKKAGLRADDLSGVEGNMKVYTPDVWAALTQQQRQDITQKNIDSGIYYSSKGGVKISDEEQALKNKEAVLASVQQALAKK